VSFEHFFEKCQTWVGFQVDILLTKEQKLHDACTHIKVFIYTNEILFKP
jgi:hypothetical protein